MNTYPIEYFQISFLKAIAHFLRRRIIVYSMGINNGWFVSALYLWSGSLNHGMVPFWA